MSDEKVVPLRKGTIIPEVRHEPQPEVISELEELLADARTGELQGFAYAGLSTTNVISSRYVGYISRGLVGGLFSVMNRMNKQVDDDFTTGEK